MKIKQTQVISPGDSPENKPDAVKIEILGVSVLVNMHSGVVTIDNAAHVDPKAGENNTLEIYACPKIPDLLDIHSEGYRGGFSSLLFGGLLDDFLGEKILLQNHPFKR